MMKWFKKLRSRLAKPTIFYTVAYSEFDVIKRVRTNSLRTSIPEMELVLNGFDLVEWLNSNTEGRYTIQYMGVSANLYNLALKINANRTLTEPYVVIGFGYKPDAVLFRLNFTSHQPYNPLPDLVEIIKKRQLDFK